MPRSLRHLVTPVVGALALLACASSGLAGPVAEWNARDGVALHGYDPVAYFREGAAVLGLAEHSLVWRGATWRFASADHRSLFEGEPERYAPQYGGYCAYALSIDRIADIDPDAWEIVDDRLYLNNNQVVHTLWKLGRDGRIEDADRHWAAHPKREVSIPRDRVADGGVE